MTGSAHFFPQILSSGGKWQSDPGVFQPYVGRFYVLCLQKLVVVTAFTYGKRQRLNRRLL